MKLSLLQFSDALLYRFMN